VRRSQRKLGLETELGSIFVLAVTFIKIEMRSHAMGGRMAP